jgi:hypothetical protein
MSQDWLLVETLGSEPAVVAHGPQLKNLVPISVFLRRSPHLSAIQTAIAETVSSGTSLASITPKGNRVIRTEPVLMTDGTMHGVHVWLGPADEEPPERALPGPLLWNLTTGVATDTPQSLRNSGLNPDTEATHGRAFAEDLPSRDLNPSEARVLAMAVAGQPGATYCNTWDVTDSEGQLITVGFVARAELEAAEGGAEHLIARAMNWRSTRETPSLPPENLAQRILDGLARPGTHRALVDLRNWKLLKWLDEPSPLYDWRGATATQPLVHPDDQPLMPVMTKELEDGMTTRVLRLRAPGGGWVPIHVVVNRVELDDGVYAGLITTRLATADDPHP